MYRRIPGTPTSATTHGSRYEMALPEFRIEQRVLLGAGFRSDSRGHRLQCKPRGVAQFVGIPAGDIPNRLAPGKQPRLFVDTIKCLQRVTVQFEADQPATRPPLCQLATGSGLTTRAHRNHATTPDPRAMNTGVQPASPIRLERVAADCRGINDRETLARFRETHRFNQCVERRNKTSDNAAAPRQIVGPEAIRPGFVLRYDDVGLKCFGVLRLLTPAPESDSPLHARRLEIRWQPHVVRCTAVAARPGSSPCRC